MGKIKSSVRAFLVLGQILFMTVLFTAPCFAVSDSPLQLSAKYHVNEHTLDVAIVTTEEITLSNYDAQLVWDAEGCTLDRITNGQPDAFSNFFGNPASGKIAATSSGTNVTIGANEVLAVYTFSVMESGTDTPCTFTLTITDAADENGDSLSWKDMRVSETAGLSATAEIKQITREGTTITCSVFCSKSDAILCCAAYTNAGQLAAIQTVQAADTGEQEYEFHLGGIPYDYVELFVLNGDFQPQCPSERTP